MKSEYLSQQKINCDNSDGFKVNGIGIKVVESARYLGDLFNIKGDNSDMCRERHLKAKGTSVELCSLSRGLSFGIRQIESMLILYKTVFVPRLIYNCEAWSKLKAADYKILQSAQLKFMRKILEVPRSTPTAALYLELGIWPIRYEIEIRQLFFLKRVLNKTADDPCLQVYFEMLKFKDEPNWGNEVLGLRKKYNLPLKDENIKNMSERDWKSIVKSSVHREALLQLQVELSMNRKTSHLSYIKLCTQDYLKQLPPSLAKVVFRAKTRMLDIKTNYKSKYYENLKCPFCCVLDESFGHLFTCRFGIRVQATVLWVRSFTADS